MPPGLDEGWLTGLELEQDDRRHQDSAAAPLSVYELDDVDAFVTGSAVAVAETGTIILDGSPNQGRGAITLVPDHHICIVKVSDISEILPEALRRIDGTRPLTMISGPSTTSDIELERVEGVHGPASSTSSSPASSGREARARPRPWPGPDSPPSSRYLRRQPKDTLMSAYRHDTWRDLIGAHVEVRKTALSSAKDTSKMSCPTRQARDTMPGKAS